MPISDPRLATLADTVNGRLLDRAIRHALFFQRLSTGEVKKIIDFYEKYVFPDLIKKYQAALKKSFFKQGYLGSWSTKRLIKLIDASHEIMREGTKRAYKIFKHDLLEIGKSEASWKILAMEQSLPPMVATQVDFIMPSSRTLQVLMNENPFQGRLTKKWFGDLSGSLKKRVTNELKTGLIQGESIPKLTSRIRAATGGTKRHIETIVRTAVKHQSSLAKMAAMEANSDVVKGWQFVATLDSRTCFPAGTKVQLMDGKKAPIETLVPGQEIISGTGKKRRITAIKCSRTRAICKIRYKTKDSYIEKEIEATETHPFWTSQGRSYKWVESKNIKSGDYIATLSMQSMRKGGNKLQKQTKEILQPRMLCGRNEKEFVGREELCLLQKKVQGKKNLCQSEHEIGDSMQQRMYGCNKKGRIQKGRIGLYLHRMWERIQNKTRQNEKACTERHKAITLQHGMQKEKTNNKMSFLQETIRNDTGKSMYILQPRMLFEIRNGDAARKGNKNGTCFIANAVQRTSKSATDTYDSGFFNCRSFGYRDGWNLLACENERTGQKEGKSHQSNRMEILENKGKKSWPIFLSNACHASNPTPNGHAVVISSEIIKRNCYVYDIEVEEDHCFLVEDGLIVHNSDICMSLDGTTYNLGEGAINVPPLHHQCRSEPVEIMKSWDELGIKGLKEIPQGQRASMTGLVPAKTTYSGWLKQQPRWLIDEALGPGKAKIFLRGTVPLSRFVDKYHNPLTIKQLEALEIKMGGHPPKNPLPPKMHKKVE